MSTRQRSATASRKDAYGLWRPSDSDSDRPRQTMAATQRHNEDKHATADGSRKHRSSRRTDPVDPTASHSHHHKSSSRDRTSTALPSSYPSVPQSPAPSAQYRAQDAYSDAYGLRAYIKRRADKRSPRSSNERVPGGDDPQTSRSAYPSRHDYATTASYAQPPAAANYYAATSDQTTRDPTSSSRRHRERDKDREKSSRRDAEKASTRSRTVETPEERERRKRKEKEVRKEKEKSSKDRERRREKERSGDQEARTAGDLRQPDVASVHQGYGKGPVPAERSTERLPAGYPDYGRTPVPQATSVQPSAPPTAPWNGLTAGGRVIPQLSTPVVDAGYPSASDREDPPLPIPPPGSRRERSSSKARHSQRHQMLAQQAGQDSGISSSEQEHSVMERARRYISREQASTLGRGQSSGPSGSENEKAPTLQKERRKHKTRGESSRHRSRTAATDPQEPPGPSTSQEIAAAWYQRHQRDASATKPSVLPGESSQHPPTAAPYNPGPTQSVSIRAGQGPPEPHAGTLLPKTHSSTSIARQADPQPTDRAQDAATRLPTATQYNQQTAARQLEALLQSTPGQPHHLTHADTSRTYQHASAVSGTAGAYQQPVYPSATSSSQHVQSNAVAATVGHGGQQVVLPDVVIRPPSAAPTQHDPYSSRATAGVPPTSFQQGGRLQPNDPRSRSTPAPQQNAGHTQMTPATSNQLQGLSNSTTVLRTSTESQVQHLMGRDIPKEFHRTYLHGFQCMKIPWCIHNPQARPQDMVRSILVWPIIRSRWLATPGM
ncbi:hypothetical protein C8Q78DRAFT_114059 [Trametes maxima]|nr:hypothetical protein C8Q78DRAFT_114059 [Trametes maxima]